MNRRSTTTAIIATSVIVALLSGCSGDDDLPADAATTSASPHSVSPSPVSPPDQATMGRLATEEVIQHLADRGGAYWDRTSSEGAAGSTIVTYTNTESGDTLALRVENQLASQGAEQAVVEARYTDGPDSQAVPPTVPEDYADSLVVAWGEGDQATVQQLATDEVVQTLGEGGSPHWERISTEGAAGSTIVTYSETQTGQVLSLRVDNAQASQGAEHAVVEARLQDG